MIATLRGSILAVLAVVFFASACTGSSSDQADSTPNPASTVGAATASSPLTELIGFSADAELNRQRFAAIQNESDSVVAACMDRQGLPWVAATPLPGSSLARGNRASLAWARAHGLGVTDQVVGLARAMPEDPNARYLATLAEADREQWQLALRGDTTDLPAADEPVAFAPAGCLGEGFAATRPAFELYQLFEADLQVLERRIQADPRMVAHDELWADCMASNGFAFSTTDAMSEDVFRRLLDLPGVSTLMTASGPLPEGTEVFDVVDQAAFEELAAFEREIAVANVTCDEPFAIEAEDIRDAYEREFIVDHRPRLDEAATAFGLGT